MKSFDIPGKYRSELIGKIKDIRTHADQRKRDFSPTLLNFSSFQLFIARHFGFCFGVQNAVERIYQVLNEKPHQKIYLISELVHNPTVNEDLKSRGIQFLQTTNGKELLDWSTLSKDDIVMIPAFGAPLSTLDRLRDFGVQLESYDTTCPFVVKVWNRGEQLAREGYTIIIHGDFHHEETRSTFSRISQFGKSVVVKDLKEARMLSDFMHPRADDRDWNVFFHWKASEGFKFREDLKKVAIVNQTTMLASETTAISEFFKQKMQEKFPDEPIEDHFAQTRDTLCYATNDNQQATEELLSKNLDLCIVVGGQNSANTNHLVEILEANCPTYFISSADQLEKESVLHFDRLKEKTIQINDWLPYNHQPKIGLTSGASCPDAIMEDVIQKLIRIFEVEEELEAVIEQIESTHGF